MRKLREPPADSGQAFSVPHRPRLRTYGFLLEILSQDFTPQGKQFAKSTQEAESLYGRGAVCPSGWASVFLRWLGSSDLSNCGPPGRLGGTKVTTPAREKRPSGGRDKILNFLRGFFLFRQCGLPWLGPGQGFREGFPLSPACLPAEQV